MSWMKRERNGEEGYWKRVIQYDYIELCRMEKRRGKAGEIS